MTHGPTFDELAEIVRPLVPRFSYEPQGLFVLAYATGFTSWHYRTGHALRIVTEPGYFDGAYDMVRDGDRLSVNVVQHGGEALAVECQDFIVSRQHRRVALIPTTQPAFPRLAMKERMDG